MITIYGRFTSTILGIGQFTISATCQPGYWTNSDFSFATRGYTLHTTINQRIASFLRSNMAYIGIRSVFLSYLTTTSIHHVYAIFSLNILQGCEGLRQFILIRQRRAIPRRITHQSALPLRPPWHVRPPHSISNALPRYSF